MSRGISQQQRDILRLALAVNIFTQGGEARVKAGAPVDRYLVPTVGYEGPKDLRPPLALWALGGARTSLHVAGFFEHDRASKTAKASITRAVTRLLERKLLVLAPLPRHHGSDDKRPDWGYCLTAEGLAQAGEPLDVPMLAEACELFGITVCADYDWAARRWKGERKRELMALLGNGYRREGVDPSVTDTPSEVRAEASVTKRQICRPVTVPNAVTKRPPLPTDNRFDDSVTDVQWRDAGNRDQQALPGSCCDVGNRSEAQYRADAAALPKKERRSLEQVEAQLRAMFADEVQRAVHEEFRRRHPELVAEMEAERDAYMAKHLAAATMKASMHAILTEDDYRLLLNVLHPDRAPADRQEKFARAFDAVRKLDPYIQAVKA